jgi:sulfate permease, SulP family
MPDSEVDSPRKTSQTHAIGAWDNSDEKAEFTSPITTRAAGRPNIHGNDSMSMSTLHTSLVGLSKLLTSSTADESGKECSGSAAAPKRKESPPTVLRFLGQIPAIALITLFHLMIGIPFGVSYFPMSWSPDVEEPNADEGPFPLPGKEALGIRMFLFSTVVAQIAFTLTSRFKNPIGLQMVENVPFTHELSMIVIQHQGYGVDALSTLMVMFGLSSIVVGVVFYTLGKYKLGRIVYFFPTHVLIGCIGGIGVFLAKTGMEVAMATVFSMANLLERWELLWLVFAFELVLRTLGQILKGINGQPRYPLLSPIYFCLITPTFYLGLWIAGVTIEKAIDKGFFFPTLDGDNTADSGVGGGPFNVVDGHTWDMWAVIDLPTVCWPAIRESLPTLLALSLFSLIHVPINIPAFALSTKTETQMDAELLAHGYSNMVAGMFGGLQNYMAYTQSVLYAKSGGTGKASGFAVAATTSILFFVGPAIASFIPRCMAGTLLLHVGVDLFLEGVWDSYGKFDLLEYSGILLIMVVMTAYGMEAAMVAGIVAAVSTYAVQSVAYLSPVRGSMSAATLRSSEISRSTRANRILDSMTDGRSRILVVQLQGHLFFGNMANFTDTLHRLVSNDGTQNDLPPIVIIVDCSLVLGIDSSAAHAISKLKDTLLKNHGIQLFVFVAGSDKGFPTEFPLTADLSAKGRPLPMMEEHEVFTEITSLIRNNNAAYSVYHGSHVSDTLDQALSYAENALIARVDPSLLEQEQADLQKAMTTGHMQTHQELNFLKESLRKICSTSIPDNDADALCLLFERETYQDGDYLWRQHSESDCAKLLISGLLMAKLENEAGTTECVMPGTLIGELGLLNRDPRMSSVQCISDECVVYSLSSQTFDALATSNPRVARYIDLVCIRYLALRVQHVSNRIFETRCLPI